MFAVITADKIIINEITNVIPINCAGNSGIVGVGVDITEGVVDWVIVGAGVGFPVGVGAGVGFRVGVGVGVGF